MPGADVTGSAPPALRLSMNLALRFALLAFALRIGWIVVVTLGSPTPFASSDPISYAFPDERLHWELGSNLVSRGALVSDDGRYAARMPGYPLWVAMGAWAGPTVGVLLVRAMQAACGAIVVGLIVSFAERVWGRRSALVAGVLTALDPFAIFMTAQLLSEVPYTLALVGFVLGALRLGARRRSGSNLRGVIAAFAILAAACVFIRPASLVFVLPLMGMVGWRDLAARSMPWATILALGLLAIGFTSWGIRNTLVLGSPALLSANGGVTLLDGLRSDADGGSDQQFLDEPPLNNPELGEVERDGLAREMALRLAWEDPARVAQLAVLKFQRMWSLTPNVETAHGSLKAGISAGYMLVSLGLALIGSMRLAGQRGGWRLLAITLLPVVLLTAVHCVYVGSVRYRVPLMPLVSLIAAASVRNDQGGAVVLDEAKLTRTA